MSDLARLGGIYLAGPLAPESYFLGMSAGILVVYLPPVVVVGVLAAVVVPLSAADLVLLLGLSAVVWVTAAAIGYIFSTAFRDIRAIWAYSSLFFNVFGVLPPVFYPLGFFPSALRPVVLLMPPSAAAALMQRAIGVTQLSGGELALAVGGLAVEAVLLLGFAIVWARRTVRGR